MFALKSIFNNENIGNQGYIDISILWTYKKYVIIYFDTKYR